MVSELRQCALCNFLGVVFTLLIIFAIINFIFMACNLCLRRLETPLEQELREYNDNININLHLPAYRERDNALPEYTERDNALPSYSETI